MYTVVFKCDPKTLNYIWNFTKLSTQILVQSNLGHILVHLSVKSHVYHVKYTDISSILHLDTFSFLISVKSHVFHVNNKDFI